MSNRFIKQSQCAIVGIFATAALMGLGVVASSSALHGITFCPARHPLLRVN
ncbi:unknown [Prevotella sp. CAG:732]|nr:unknown [Prevotella sp. CAG:732]